MIASGMMEPEKYVTEVLPLEQLQEAFVRQTTADDPVVKIVIKL